MKRYITHTLLCLLVLLVACNNSGLGLLPEDGDGHIVLNFSATDSQTRLGDHDIFESLVEHIDVFVTDNSKGEDEEDGIIHHHERFTIGNNSNGTITLQGIRLSALIGKTIRIYAVANSTKAENVLSALNGQSVKSLKEQIEVQPLVYLTGTGLAGGGMTAPHSFLMWGEGEYDGNTEIFIDNNVIGDLAVTLPLKRSVAKVEFLFLRETGLDSNGNSNGKTPNIHGFGYPKYNNGSDAVTPGGENNDITLEGLEYIAEGSYYFNNLPFKTYFAPNDDSNIPSEGLRKTTPIYNNGHFHYENQDTVKIVAYVYSYSWDKEDSEFENAPRMVVNLPAVVYNDGREKGTYLEDNFYEIQLRMPLPQHVVDGKIKIERNKHYIIKAKINAPGSKSSFEPIEIDQPIYFEEREWTDVNIDIGGDNNNHARATYLTLNTDLVEMRNVETDNKTMRFASSSPLSEIRLTKATYIDKWGVERDTTGFTYSVTYPENALQGSITINADLPENDALRSMTFSVKNSDATPLTETFTVKQYPAITISNIRAWFSYREDFNSWYTKEGEHKGKAVWNDNNQTWSYPNNLNSLWADNTVFISKVAKFESGAWKIYPYYWFQVIWWIKMDAQNWGNFGNYFASDLTNARIYHVTINATGAGAGAYTIGRPRMDSEGYTDAGSSNAQLISPSFMIASQLGESSNMKSFTNYQPAAKEHCKQYVEVYEDENGQEVHLKGWRLPTAAEIQILLDRQGIANAAVDEVLPGKQYISASGVVNGKTGGKDGIYIRCIRDHYVPTANAMNE